MANLEGKTVKLRDKDNNVILPRTLAQNVHMADGTLVEKAIADLVAKVQELEAKVEELSQQAPVQPDQPVDPEQPDTPVDPEQPDTPVDPEPEDPEQPVEDHSGDLRIAQYYGAGGKTDGMLSNDFIELYNMGEHDVPLKGITLNYTKMGKTADAQNQWQLIQLPDVVLPAHHSFLIQGQMNREDAPMIVAEADMDCGMELDNGAVKLVLSKATEAYPAGQVDPFEVDETIIDHVYAAAEDKLDRLDVEVMVDDLSKHNAALQEADGIWDVADYKDSEDMPQNEDKLPHNMAAGAHDLIKLVGPSVDDVVFEQAELEAAEGEFVAVLMVNPVEDFVASEVEVDDVVVDMGLVQIDGEALQVSVAMLLERAGETIEIKVKSDKYYRIKFDATINATVVEPEPDEPTEPEQPVEPEVPVEPALAPIVYGYIPVAVVTEFGTPQYDQITLEMVQQGVLKEADAPVEGKIDLFDGYSAEGDYLFIAVRSDIDLDINKDDGFGGHMDFNEDTRGANGVAVMFDGVEYKVYGEIALTDAIWYVYMD